MKHVTATEARKNWFRLLDEAAGGEVIVIDREGARLVLQREDQYEDMPGRGVPSYKGLIWAAEDADQADRWGWEWSDTDEGLTLVERKP